MSKPERSKKAEDAIKQVLYELGFLNKKGEVEKNKERRWKMNINEAELILKDFMRRNGHLDSCKWDWTVNPNQHSFECQMWQDSLSKNADIADLVIEDIKKRKEFGEKKYGVPLRPFNGRDAIQDLYEELLDATQYIRQYIEETEVFEATIDDVTKLQ